MNKRIQHWLLSFLSLLVISIAFLGHATDTPETFSSEIGATFQNGYAGDAVAQYDIGMFYLHGVDSGGEYLESNQQKARKWISHAANQGNADAQIQLGLMYAAGTGGEKDDSIAVSWIGKAAKQNHPRALDMLHWMSQSAH
ncbi:tetratricopeptide repeat protein [Vibrio methylphosphonaticus]|uniref:tetratricopeptide repeat protein n=1 Tax=Vibrio methylphosphonaticus TaxID=2946866 RepID=UPI00202ABB73|nr:tetratricopeptide repeat protein [Vibrio methylphosphonaticus]MCL9775876.1 sel1 repeat family protein [Vibrio methylphosphonaticus]